MLSLRNLHVGECRAHVGQDALANARYRMRGAEDPSPPLDYVLHDGLGFEQVVACVEIKSASRRRHGTDIAV